VGALRWTAALAVATALGASPGATRADEPPVIDTAIDAGPADASLIETDSPSFSFSATRDGAPFPGASFQCSVDEGPYQACASPLTLSGLAEGPHSFAVFAEDREVSVADPEPARRGFLFYRLEEECESPGPPAGGDPEEEPAEGAFVEEPQAGCPGSGGGTLPPEECLLRTAEARVLTYTAQSRIRMVIRYMSFSPADVVVGYRLTGARGPLSLGAARPRFAGSGVFRMSERLGQPAMERVRAARRFTVTIEVPSAPCYCRRYQVTNLTVRHIVHGQVAWSAAARGEAARGGDRPKRKPAR
jgi:hypothetical protein